MDSYQYRVKIKGVGLRPPYGEVVDHVYGIGANVDTDGDSSTPSSIDWTWLCMCQRPTRNAPVVEAILSDDRSDVMIVASEDRQLAYRAAEFLAARTGGKLINEAA